MSAKLDFSAFYEMVFYNEKYDVIFCSFFINTCFKRCTGYTYTTDRTQSEEFTYITDGCLQILQNIHIENMFL